MCYRSDNEEQMEFIRKYNEKRAEMKSKQRKFRKVVKIVIGVTTGVIVVSVLMRVGMMLLM
jgi:hypothetical protein